MIKTRSFYNHAIKAVVWEINDFVSTEDFKQVAEETHYLRKKYFLKKQLNNLKNMKVLSKDIQMWVKDVWFSDAKKTGLKHFAFVVPEDDYGKLTMESVTKNASEKYGMEIEYFLNENDAKEWLISKN